MGESASADGEQRDDDNGAPSGRVTDDQPVIGDCFAFIAFRAYGRKWISDGSICCDPTVCSYISLLVGMDVDVVAICYSGWWHGDARQRTMTIVQFCILLAVPDALLS